MLSRELVTRQQIIMNFPQFLNICCHVTNSHVSIEPLLLMNTVRYSRKLQDFETKIYFVNFVYQIQE